MSRLIRTGLEVVERVRRVHESDSRRGLHLAQRETADARQMLSERLRQLADLDRGAPTTPGELLRQREGLLALGDAIVAARESVASAQLMETAAQDHWQQHRVRLRAIEMLQERRRGQVRAERARAQARVDDETATQVWLRGSASGGVPA